MMKRLQLVIDCLLLSALVLPMALASNVADFVAHPFTTRGVATIASTSKRATTTTKSPVIMASRSIKTLSKQTPSPRQQQQQRNAAPRFPNYAWEGGGSGSAASREEVMAFDDDHNNMHDDDDSDEDDLYFTQLLEGHELHTKKNNKKEHSNNSKASVLYRYFGKSRSRLRNHDSIPFIFLGPSLDHWKEVGQTLASRGFSVMACEASLEDQQQQQQHDGNNDSSALLVEEILEALKWNRAILVGCDKEAIMAIRAALQLAPDRIAGLILCGDMTEVMEIQEGFQDTVSGNNNNKMDIDTYLQQHVQCPYSVIWDGAAATTTNTATNNEELREHHRCLIRGGGSAPHRRLPEQFAWALTRFVEEQVAPVIADDNSAALTSTRGGGGASGGGASRGMKFMDRLVTPGGLLVAGRVLAEAVFYVSAMKVMLYQYENIYWGMSKVSSGYRTIFSAWPKQVLKLLGRALFVGTATSRRSSSGMQDDDDDDDEPMITLQPQDFFQQEQKEEQTPPVVDEEEEPVIEEELEEEPILEDVEEAPIHWPIPLLNPIVV